MTKCIDSEIKNIAFEWANSDAEKGEIFTKNNVVQFMIAITGLYDEFFLESTRILEPSCGKGEFLIELTNLLIDNILQSQKKPDVNELKRKIVAFDIVEDNIVFTKKILSKKLSTCYSHSDVEHILSHWLRHGDFLLEDMEGGFTHVLGNPPYIRIEDIPKALLLEYRKRYATMENRADLYIPFFEKSLSLLRPNGKHVFICTDRWTKNTYGKALRSLIAKSYSLRFYADLYGYDAFQSEVMTYPAITLIEKECNKPTLIKKETTLSKESGLHVHKILQYDHPDKECELRTDVVRDDLPFHLGNTDEVKLVKKLERLFPKIEETGCKIYVGAATGNNKVYVVDRECPIERSRRIPVITASEIKEGKIQWKGKYVVNVYDNGSLIDIDKFPRLKSYLSQYKEKLSQRHIVKHASHAWFKTIDKIHPDRAERHKLLISDISSSFTAVYDKGEFHPNNSIYYIISEEWPLDVLKIVLESGIAQLFINVYSTKISNGYHRFQAQHLRKICLPKWDKLTADDKNTLIELTKKFDKEETLAFLAKIFYLENEDLSTLKGCL